MAYNLFSRTFDINLRNSIVTISNKYTGTPAIILESPSGGILSQQGIAKLDNNAQLNVVIDTAQEWTVKILDGQVLEYNVLDPKKIVTLSDLKELVPEIGVTYVLDTPPYPEYTWDGTNLISSLTSAEIALVQSLDGSNISDITYDVDGEISSYKKNGIQHNVDKPDAFTLIFSNETGTTRIVTRDSNGKVTNII